jgi:hypothetical protein
VDRAELRKNTFNFEVRAGRDRGRCPRATGGTGVDATGATGVDATGGVVLCGAMMGVGGHSGEWCSGGWGGGWRGWF